MVFFFDFGCIIRIFIYIKKRCQKNQTNMFKFFLKKDIFGQIWL